MTGGPAGRRNRWNGYRDAAVAGMRSPREGPAESLSERLRRRAFQRSIDQGAIQMAPGRWRDLRLVPLGAAAWAGAAAGGVVAPDSRHAALAAVVGAAVAALMGGAACMVGLMRSSRARGVVALCVCVLLAGAAGTAAALEHAVVEREGPAGDLLEQGGTVIATVVITGDPTPQRSSRPFASASRYTAAGTLVCGKAEGRVFSASAAILVAGGSEAASLRAGTTVEVSGRVVPSARAGGSALLSISSRPKVVATDPPRQFLAGVRESLRASAGWLSSDAAGLLPGMTVGDTAALPADLETAMRDVGLGHLTAVSGANFTLLFGAVLLALRLVRASRPASVLGCAAALLAFAAVVGPEPSVLRAAAMGAVGLLALLSGRAGRSCSAVSAAVLVLVLLEPALALSMGFLLSVAATLGIAVLGPPLTVVLAARLPAWLAAAVAVPLSAQLTCGPLIVLVQPAFLSMSLAANLLSAPFVPVVTVAGTIALAVCTWCPPAAFLATAVGGAAAQAVASVARVLAQAPGATVPWPEGLAGAFAMAGLSAVNAVALWAVLLPTGRRWMAWLWAVLSQSVRSRVDGILGLGRGSRHGRVEG
ncbi:hypothetical protein GCM10012320_00910 [Sinomonas cellulolyticus]|nr:hypothetical protein GCM10012320_00910 [Sinomonas sp. KCTC 49339]